MTAAHIHLLFNHFPIIGALLAIPLLALAIWKGGRGLLAGAGVVLGISGVTGAVAYFTGEPTEESVEDLPGVSEPMIHEHEERAEVAIVLMAVAGLVGAAAGVRAMRAGAAPGRGWAVAALVPTLAAAGAMVATGASGGEIRRPELRDPTVATVSEGGAARDDD